MRDEIRLTGLRVRGFHGVFDFEKEQGQDFLIDVVLRADLSAPAASDALADTVDYGGLADDIAQIVAGERYDLIEALAGSIAEHCLAVAPEAEVTVHKPQAPIAHTFSDVSVTLRRRRSSPSRFTVTGDDATAADEATAAGVHVPAAEAPDGGRADLDAALAAGTAGRAVLALGANLGDPEAALREAVDALARHPRVSIEGASSLWATAPVGGVEQPDYVNAALTVRTVLPPRELLAACQGIEAAAGRTREVRWGPRALDIDLIRYVPADRDSWAESELTGADEVLTLPHPRAAERAFVLAPWAELEPGTTVRTASGPVPIAEALAAADDASGVRRIEAEPLLGESSP